MFKIRIHALLASICVVLFMSSCSKIENEKDVPLEEVDDVCSKMDDLSFMKFCYDKFDVNHDGMVSMSEAAAVKSISIERKNITSVKGIEYFTSLVSLNCSGNPLSSLDISKNKSLTSLDCNGTSLTSLDLSKNTNLTSLNCSGTSLTSLDLSKNTNLTSLDCYFVKLSSLDLSKNTKLTTLKCNFCELTSLDLSKNTSLASLNCSFNELTSLDLSKNTSLSYLYCYQNRIASLDISMMLNVSSSKPFVPSPVDFEQKVFLELTISQKQYKALQSKYPYHDLEEFASSHNVKFIVK